MKVLTNTSETRMRVSAMWATCCFNNCCADVAEAKKPQLKRHKLEKEKEEIPSVCTKQWKNWPLRAQMNKRHCDLSVIEPYNFSTQFYWTCIGQKTFILCSKYSIFLYKTPHFESFTQLFFYKQKNAPSVKQWLGPKWGLGN